MGFSIFLIVTLVIILIIYILIEIKRAKHKVFAIVVIILILFMYFSIAYVFKGQNVDYKSVHGIEGASKIYLAWLGGFYGNVKTVTINAIKMNWSANNINKTSTQNKTSIPSIDKTTIQNTAKKTITNFGK